MMNNSIEELNNRFTKIKYLVSVDEISEAFKQISFLNEYYNISRENQREIIALRNEYNNLNREIIFIGGNERYVLRNALIRKIVKIVDDLEDECKENIVPQKNQKSVNLNTEDSTHKILYAELNNVTKNYKDFALRNISIQLYSGEITALIGLNGNGKTTLLKLIAGVEKIDSGELSYPKLSNTNWYEIKRHIGYIPQTLEEQKLNLTDSLKLSATTHGVNAEDLDIRYNDVIGKLVLDQFLDKKWRELSGGYKMRYELAKMMIRRPNLLLLDEPLANLDPTAQKVFLNDLKSYSRSVNNPVSILISSQHIEAIEQIADKIIYLDDGRIIFNGNREDIIQIDNKILVEMQLSNCNNIEKLSALFSKYNFDVGIRLEFDTYILEVPSNLNIMDTMKIIIENGFVINYFRDITLSSKKLLIKNK